MPTGKYVRGKPRALDGEALGVTFPAPAARTSLSSVLKSSAMSDSTSSEDEAPAKPAKGRGAGSKGTKGSDDKPSAAESAPAPVKMGSPPVALRRALRDRKTDGGLSICPGCGRQLVMMTGQAANDHVASCLPDNIRKDRVSTAPKKTKPASRPIPADSPERSWIGSDTPTEEVIAQIYGTASAVSHQPVQASESLLPQTAGVKRSRARPGEGGGEGRTKQKPSELPVGSISEEVAAFYGFSISKSSSATTTSTNAWSTLSSNVIGLPGHPLLPHPPSIPATRLLTVQPQADILGLKKEAIGVSSQMLLLSNKAPLAATARLATVEKMDQVPHPVLALQLWGNPSGEKTATTTPKKGASAGVTSPTTAVSAAVPRAAVPVATDTWSKLTSGAVSSIPATISINNHSDPVLMTAHVIQPHKWLKHLGSLAQLCFAGVAPSVRANVKPRFFPADLHPQEISSFGSGFMAPTASGASATGIGPAARIACAVWTVMDLCYKKEFADTVPTHRIKRARHDIAAASPATSSRAPSAAVEGPLASCSLAIAVRKCVENEGISKEEDAWAASTLLQAAPSTHTLFQNNIPHARIACVLEEAAVHATTARILSECQALLERFTHTSGSSSAIAALLSTLQEAGVSQGVLFDAGKAPLHDFLFTCIGLYHHARLCWEE